MIITSHLHYPNGIYNAIQSPQCYSSSGYIPSRRDELIHAHIVSDTSYEVYIDQYSLILKYKYIKLYATHFTIGPKTYPLRAIDTYRGKEIKHLTTLRELRDELLHSSTLYGLPIEQRLTLLLREMTHS